MTEDLDAETQQKLPRTFKTPGVDAVGSEWDRGIDPSRFGERRMGNIQEIRDEGQGGISVSQDPYHGVSNYQGPGYYTHYKGGKYCVLGLSVKEDTVDKERAPEDGDEIHGQILVIYKPLSPGSLLPRLTMMDEGMASAEVTFWARSLDDFNALIKIDHNHCVRRFQKSEVEYVNRGHVNA